MLWYEIYLTEIIFYTRTHTSSLSCERVYNSENEPQCLLFFSALIMSELAFAKVTNIFNERIIFPKNLIQTCENTLQNDSTTILCKPEYSDIFRKYNKEGEKNNDKTKTAHFLTYTQRRTAAKEPFWY